MTMKLSEAGAYTNFSVLRDMEFLSLGFVTHQSTGMLVFLEDAMYLSALLSNKCIACVVTDTEIAKELPSYLGIAVSSSPRKAFYKLHNYLAMRTGFYWRSSPTFVDETAKIHPTAYIAERDVKIGKRVIVEPNVTILERVYIEDDVIIRSGVVIGTEGFEFNLIDNKMMPVIHAGGVCIHKRVEIQANCCVCKSIFGGFTELDDDTKLDNMVHIAHNVKVGKRCRLAACTMVAGSVTIGDNVWVGPSVSISSEVKIGDKANLTIGSVVTKDVKPGQMVTGNFAIDHDKFIENLRKLR